MRKRIGYILLVLLTFILCCAFAVGCDSGGGSGNNNGSWGNGSTNVPDVPNPPSRDYYILTIVDGTSKREEYIYFEESNHLVPPTRFGYTFEGYFTADDNMIFNESGVQTDLLIDHDMTLYPKWDPNRIEVFFDAGEGTMDGIPDEYYDFGDTLPTLPLARRDGWEFKGWYVGDMQVTDSNGFPSPDYNTVDEQLLGEDGAVHFTARYTAIYFSVTLHWQSDDRPETEELGKYRMYDKLEASDLPTVEDSTEREGKRFKGWTLQWGDTYSGGTVTSDLDLYAKWVNYRTLTFHPFADNPSADFDMVVEDGVSYPAPTYEGEPGYNLDGWYPNKEVNTSPVKTFRYNNTTDSEDFYAKWSLINYNVEFRGDTYISPQTYTVNSSLTLPDLGEKNGMPFLGWCESPDYEGDIITEIPVGHTGHMVLYPVWRDFTVVTCYVDGAKQGDSIKIRYGTTFVLTPPSFSDRIFDYWYFIDNGEEVPLTNAEGSSLSAWNRNDEQISVHAKYRQTYALTLSYIDYKTGRTNKISLGRHVESDQVTVSLPSALTSAQFFGYMVQGSLLSPDRTFTYTMPARDTEITIDYFYYPTDADASKNFGHTVYQYGGHYYAYVDITYSWTEAEDYCAFYGGHLITIADSRENEFAAAVLRKEAGVSCWIGGQFADGEWKWVTGGAFNYHDWADGEPNGNASAPYIALDSNTNYKWNDCAANSRFTFLCEWEKISDLSLPTEISDLTDKDGGNISLTAYSYGGHYYAFIQTPMLWTDAELYSEYLGGTLVAVNNAEENDFVLRLMRHNNLQSIFIGGTDCQTEGTFVWATGEPFIYNNWRRGEPNDGSNNQDYAALYLDGWDDAYNNNSFSFMIEWDSYDAIGKPTYKFLRRQISSEAVFLSSILLPSAELELNGDLDLSGHTIPSVTFTGTLNGNNRTIKYRGGQSLFATLKGTVYDLKINVTLEAPESSKKLQYGGLAGILSGGTVYNVTVEGSVTATPSGLADIGGIVGEIEGAASLYNCTNYATVTTKSSGNNGCAGGIVGWLNSAPAKFEGNTNYGAVNANDNAGGIVGWSGVKGITLKNCTNRGTVTATGVRAGGIVGNAYQPVTVDGCASIGKITATSNLGRYAGAGNCTVGNPVPIAISSPVDLAFMAVHTTVDTFYLDEELTLTDWTPFDFSATFDGKGKTIHITGSRGLFATVTGTVHDLTLDVTITDTTSTTAKVVRGALADILNKGIIYNITVTGSISVKPTSNDTDLGGIIGQLTGAASVYSCTNSATVEGVSKNNDNGCVGGIVGSVGGTPTKFEDNQNLGDIKGVNNVGGIIGWISSNTTLKNCTNRGSVTASGIRAGGFIGNTNNRASIDGGLSGGPVSATSNSGKYVGAGSCTFLTPPISEVSTPKDLLNLQFNTAEEEFRLTQDIDMQGQTWTPFNFPATLNGANFTIKNLTVTVSSSGSNAGMFSTLTGTVKNLKFENLTVTMSYNDYQNSYAVGGLAGKFEGKEISGVNILSGAIEGKTTFNYVGGIVGLFTAGTMSDCENHATVKGAATDKGVGGLIGQITNGTIRNLRNFGSVEASLATNVGGVIGLTSLAGTYTVSGFENSGTVSGKDNVGGIVGKFNGVSDSYSTPYTTTLGNFKNSAAIGGSSNVGGLIGYGYVWNNGNSISTLNATDFSNTGNVTASEGYAGGLYGYCRAESADSTLTGTSSGEVSAKYYVGGLAGYVYNVQFRNCSNEGAKVTATFYLSESGINYAYLGGYAGYGYAFYGCTNNVTLSYNERGQYVGGIAGYAYGTIQSCTNTAAVTASIANNVGGLVGYRGGAGTFMITTLSNSGNITGKDNVGGLFGTYNDASDSYSTPYTTTMGNLKNTGIISGNSNVGGLIGYGNVWNSGNSISTLNATDLSNTGKVTASEGYAGGLFGWCRAENAESALTGSSSGAISAQYYVGGLAGYVYNVQFKNCSNEGAKVTATFYLSTNGVNYVYLGGYAGYGFAFYGCTNNVTLSYSERGQFVGGIAGLAYGAVQNCTNTAAVTASNADYVGGIVGSDDGVGNLNFEDVKNSGNITGKDNVGGIFGRYYNVSSAYSSTYVTNMNRVDNSGTIRGNSNVGGLVGYGYVWNPSNGSSVFYGNVLTNTGSVNGTVTVGGLFGYFDVESASSSVTGYFMTGSVTMGDIQGNTLVGGGNGNNNIKFVS